MKHYKNIRKNMSVFLILTLSLLIGRVDAQTNPTPQSLPYTQNFGASTFSTAPTGTATWTVASSPRTNQSDAETSTPNGDASIQATTSIQTQGGCFGYYANGNARLYIQTSSNSTNGTNQFMIAINTSGLDSIIISYDIEMVSAQPRTIGTILQYRVGTSGSWTSVNGTAYSHNSSSKTNGDIDNYTDILLPTAVENDSIVQLRWAVWRGTESGNSSGLAIDNISITGKTISTRQAWITDWQLDGNEIGEYNYFLGTTDTNDLVIKTNDVERMRVNKNGVVGIGTIDTSEIGHGVVDAPERMKLDVRGDGRFTDPSGNNYVRVGYNTVNALIDNFGNGSLLINYHSGKNTVVGGSTGTFSTVNSSYFAVASGKVGIGTNNPLNKLEVAHNDTNGGFAINRKSSTTMKSQIKFQQQGVDKWTLGIDPSENMADKMFIWNQTAEKTFLTIDGYGNTAIGKDSAEAKLHVAGDVKIDSLPTMNGQLNMLVADSAGNIGVNPIPALCEAITCVSGNVGINTTGLPIAKLQVENATGNEASFIITRNDTINITMNSNGQIFARDVFIYANDVNFPDYVFENDYKQLSLGELDKYLKRNKHLPNMPSAKEIEKQGVINMNDINIKTVENVEVLYKYIIGLNEEVEKLRKEVESLKESKR